MRILGSLRSLPRCLLRAPSRLWVPIVLVLNALGLVGFFVRDRSLLLAFLLYLPLLPLGACSVGLGLGLRRSISRRMRDVLVVIGLVSMVTCSSWMLGRGPGGHHASDPEPDAQSAALERAVGPVLEPSPERVEGHGDRDRRSQPGHPGPERGPALLWDVSSPRSPARTPVPGVRSEQPRR